jgi:hypothetical protein
LAAPEEMRRAASRFVSRRNPVWELLLRAKHLFVAAIAARFHRGLRARARDTPLLPRTCRGVEARHPRSGKTCQGLCPDTSRTQNSATIDKRRLSVSTSLLKLLPYLARPEGFEPPTPRFVVSDGPQDAAGVDHLRTWLSFIASAPAPDRRARAKSTESHRVCDRWLNEVGMTNSAAVQDRRDERPVVSTLVHARILDIRWTHSASWI